MCVLLFSTNFARNISYSKKSARCYDKCKEVMVYSSCYSCQISIKLAFSQQIFAIFSSIKFNENPSSGSEVDAFGEMDEGRTDGQTDKT